MVLRHGCLAWLPRGLASRSMALIASASPIALRILAAAAAACCHLPSSAHRLLSLHGPAWLTSRCASSIPADKLGTVVTQLRAMFGSASMVPIAFCDTVYHMARDATNTVTDAMPFTTSHPYSVAAASGDSGSTAAANSTQNDAHRMMHSHPTVNSSNRHGGDAVAAAGMYANVGYNTGSGSNNSNNKGTVGFAGGLTAASSSSSNTQFVPSLEIRLRRFAPSLTAVADNWYVRISACEPRRLHAVSSCAMQHFPGNCAIMVARHTPIKGSRRMSVRLA